MAKLIGIAGVAVGKEYEVGELCIIGRSPNAHIRLPDLAVSRQHAKITVHGRNYMIEDLDSGCGTLVNKLNITVSHLRHNDEVIIANSTFRFSEQTVERVLTADFSLIRGGDKTRVVSVDASGLLPLATRETSANTVDPFKQLTRRLDAILSMGRVAASSLDTAPLLDEMLAFCMRVFSNADRALIAVPDRQRQNLVIKSLLKREGIEENQFSLTRQVTQEVLYKGRSVLAGQAPSEPGFGGIADQQNSGTIMVAPLICRGQMLGMLYVDRLSPGQLFDGDDLEVLTGMAIQAALAMHVAQMHESMLAQSRTEQELHAAREVQKRFMPRGVPKLPGFTFVAHYDPCRDVGGDLYDFIPLDQDRLGVVVGDVSGKGFAAALVMAWISSQLRVAAHLDKAPSTVLARVNEALIEARQDELFVTLFYGVLDRWSMSLQFCNAGHVPPLVRRAKNGAVEIIDDGTGMPVGVIPGSKFEEGRILLNRGDTLLLVTDGVTEAQNAKRAMYGPERLRQAVRRSPSEAPEMIRQLLADLRGFVGSDHKSDDITIVGVTSGVSIEDVRATMPLEEMKKYI